MYKISAAEQRCLGLKGCCLPGISGSFVTAAGLLNLGLRASASQILIMEVQSAVHIAGESEHASQNELLLAMGIAAPTYNSRIALKCAWVRYPEPICRVANPHAELGESLCLKG